MIKIKSKTLKASSVLSIKTTINAGFISGIVMLNTLLIGLAPSIFAASYNVSGIVCNAASNNIATSGIYFHISATATNIMDQNGSDNQILYLCIIPKDIKIEFRLPYSGLAIHFQIVALTTGGIAHGTIINVLTAHLPLKFSFKI